jgi:hypothetical protein
MAFFGVPAGKAEASTCIRDPLTVAKKLLWTANIEAIIPASIIYHLNDMGELCLCLKLVGPVMPLPF